jgi:hypothetical protein
MAEEAKDAYGELVQSKGNGLKGWFAARGSTNRFDLMSGASGLDESESFAEQRESLA